MRFQVQKATAGQTLPVLALPRPGPYLMPGREAAPTLVPCDLGMGLSGHYTVQVQSLPFGNVGRGGLDVDALGQSRGCGYNGPVRRLLGLKAGT